MTENAEIKMEELHKELDLIQGCITRMAQNSFMIKGWFIAIIAGIFALLFVENNQIALIISLVITGLFWYLDAFFLKTERIYRSIYSWVLKERKKGNRTNQYELNPMKFPVSGCSTMQVAWSKTLWPFYGIPFAGILLYLIHMDVLK